MSQPVGPKFPYYLIISLVIAALTSVVVSLYLIPGIYEFPSINTTKIVSEGKVDFQSLAASLQPKIIRVYAKKDLIAGVKVYRDEEILAFGAVITSDGWIVTIGLNQTANHLVAATSDNLISPVQKILFDQASGFSFIKIGASDLAVVDISSDVSVGEKVLALSLTSELADIKSLTAIKSGKNNHIFSSEIYPYYWELAVAKPSGTPIFNLNKELIALAVNDNGRGLIRPVKYFSSRLDKILRDQPEKRPSLGINYIDLSRWPLEITGKKPSTGGVLITDVLRNSAAARARLIPSQIITQINGEDLSLRRNLTDYLLDLKSGQEVELTVFQKPEQENKIKLKLN